MKRLSSHVYIFAQLSNILDFNIYWFSFKDILPRFVKSLIDKLHFNFLLNSLTKVLIQIELFKGFNRLAKSGRRSKYRTRRLFAERKILLDRALSTNKWATDSNKEVTYRKKNEWKLRIGKKKKNISFTWNKLKMTLILYSGSIIGRFSNQFNFGADPMQWKSCTSLL